MSDKKEQIRVERDICDGHIDKLKPYVGPAGAALGALAGGPAGMHVGLSAAPLALEVVKYAKYLQISMKHSDTPEIKALGEFLESNPMEDPLVEAAFQKLQEGKAENPQVITLAEAFMFSFALNQPHNVVRGLFRSLGQS